MVRLLSPVLLLEPTLLRQEPVPPELWALTCIYTPVLDIEAILNITPFSPTHYIGLLETYTFSCVSELDKIKIA